MKKQTESVKTTIADDNIVANTALQAVTRKENYSFSLLQSSKIHFQVGEMKGKVKNGTTINEGKMFPGR